MNLIQFSAGVKIFIEHTILTIGEEFVIFCSTNITANSISLLRNGTSFALVPNNTQLNKTISVDDSLHGSQFQCNAQLTGNQEIAYSNLVNLTIEGNVKYKIVSKIKV